MLWIHLRTLFSFRVYHRLVYASRWHLFGFLVYLTLLSVLMFYWFSGSFIKQNVSAFLKNFPQVTFEKGVLTVPPTPVYAFLPQSDFKIGFDASRQTPPTAEELVQNNLLALFMQNTVYTPSATAVQTYQLPATLSVTTSQDFLAQHKSSFVQILRAFIFMASLLFIPLILLFNFCLAGAVCFFFNILTRRHLPQRVLLRWAVFLLGPLSVLWYIRLWYNIPLFPLAQLILCIIYVQQIFNLVPEGKNAY